MTALVAAPAAEAGSPAVDAALKSADAPAAQLTATATSELPGGSVVRRFGQEVGGVPVVGAGAVVVGEAGAAAELLFDETRDEIAAPGDPRISSEAAVDAAAPGDAKHVSARQVILPGGDGTLAWEVTYTTRYPLGDWVTHVDAASGDVLSEHNLAVNATGHARLFEPNAVVENDGYDGIKDRHDKDSNLLTSLREPVVLERIDDTCLKGDWVSVRLGVDRKQVCRASRNWDDITRQNNKFEALMAYHHVDQAQSYIQGLGLSPINEESQKVTVDSIPDDNSFYQPSSDRITMGRGGVDDAEDADVMVHEYGHAVQDAQNPEAFAAGNQAGAQGEGFGDYFSQAYSTETAGFDPEWSHCVMEWDATSYDTPSIPPDGICLRRTDNDRNLTQQHKRCGRPAFGGNPVEVHCVGEIWASALSDLRELLGTDPGNDSVMDTVVLASHELLPPSPSFQQAAQALLQADDQIYPDNSDDSQMGDGDHCAEILAEMQERQFLLTPFNCT